MFVDDNWLDFDHGEVDGRSVRVRSEGNFLDLGDSDGRVVGLVLSDVILNIFNFAGPVRDLALRASEISFLFSLQCSSFLRMRIASSIFSL